MISLTDEELRKTFGTIDEIKDSALREKVLQAWQAALKESEWSDIMEIPFMPGYDAANFGFVHHVRAVAAYSHATALVYNKLEPEPVNVDHVLAGALLHDVSKVVEYAPGGGRTGWGRRVTHGIFGVHLCAQFGLPIEVTHIVSSHTSKLSMPPRTPEAIIVAKSDALAASCVHLMNEPA